MAIQKVLIVDDSAVERFAMGDMLSRMGYTVVEAIDGVDAQAKVVSHQPDLILMDVVMPGSNGFQLTRQMSRDDTMKDIPIVLCTSKDAETDRLWGMRQGAKAYLVKPLTERAFIKCVAGLEAGTV